VLLNLIPPEKTKQALGLVTEGKTVTLWIDSIKKQGSLPAASARTSTAWRASIRRRAPFAEALDIIQRSIHDGRNSSRRAVPLPGTDRLASPR
jgi:hypothetical protein